VLERPKEAPETALLPPSPNPFGAQGAWVQLPGTGQAVQLQIFDSNGQLIREQTLPGSTRPVQHHLTADRFPHAGLYTYVIRSGEQVIAGKLVYRG
jgi:hypothetical protein